MFFNTDSSGTHPDGNNSRFLLKPRYRYVRNYLFQVWAFAAFFIVGCACASLVLVKDGRPRAVVVTADEAGPTVSYAAAKLSQYVEKATGAHLPVAVESEIPAAYPVRIYLGDTEAARTVGIRADELCELGRREKMANGVRWRRNHPICLIRVVDGHLYMVGNDHVSAGHYLPEKIDGGTLYGVNDLLDRHLGVRWLWPGELGTYVPLAESLSLPAELDVIVTPKFDTRTFWRHHINRAIRSYNKDDPRHAVSFSKKGLKQYSENLDRFLVRHGVRGTGSGQFYTDHINLWPRYGESNPEYFMKDEHSNRGPVGGRSDAALCVSNPDLPRVIVEEVWDGSDRLLLGEVDHRAYCQCSDCMQWDEPQPEHFSPYSTSNRYARFWKRVRDLAVERNPDVLINVYLYMSYTHAPTIDIDLSGVQGAFCPWYSGFRPYYPKPEEEHELLKRTWLGWRETGMTMGYRPNKLLAGYVMPHISTWQTGEMFQFALQNGLAGFDFDSLRGHWAARGPMYYVLLRLANRPEMAIADIRGEFFSAFGPARDKVEEYFDYWEEYSRTEAPGGGVDWHDASRAHRLYPPQSFSPAEKMLNQAMTLAQTAERTEYAERVAFLQAGLEHARLATVLTELMGPGGTAPTEERQFNAAREALEKLISFRRKLEHLFIADYVAAAIPENRSLDLEALLRNEFVAGENDAVVVDDILQPWDTWYYRQDPDNRGDDERWFEAGRAGIEVYDAGDAGQAFNFDRDLWTRVRVPARLADTEVGDYLGYGWYAVTFTAPEEWEDRPVELHFEAVDEQAWVYVNGEYVGEHTVASEKLGIGDLWDRPFKVEVPANLIRTSEENLLVVRTHASVGAAGIWGPVGAIKAE